MTERIRIEIDSDYHGEGVRRAKQDVQGLGAEHVNAAAVASRALRGTRNDLQGLGGALKAARRETDQHSESVDRMAGSYRDANGRLRDARGRFLSAGSGARSAKVDIDAVAASGREVDGVFADANGRLRDANGRFVSMGAGARQGAGALGLFRRNSRGLHDSLLRLKLVLAAISFIPAIQGISALTSSAIALTSAIGPAIGGLAALPSVLSAIAQGAGVAALASQGVGDAIKASLDGQTSAAADAASAINEQAQAAERIRDAQTVATRADRDATRAQRDLNQTRRDARTAMRDLRLEADRGRLSEAQAIQSLNEAEAELAAVRSAPGSSDLDRTAAVQRVQEAEQRLADARRDGIEAELEYDRAKAGGVAKMPEVVAATEALGDAREQAREAAHDLSATERDAAKGAAATSAAVDKEAEAYAKLSPAAADFARFIVDLKPSYDAVRASAAEGLFPGVEEGIRDAQRLMPLIDRLVGESASVLGRTAAEAGERLGSREWMRDLDTLGARNVVTLDRMGKVGLSLAEVLRHLMVEADPLIDWLTRGTALWARNREEQAKAARETGELAGFFDDTRFALEHLFSISEHGGSALLNIFKAGKSDGDRMLVTIDRLVRRFDDWTGSVSGQDALRDWFAEGQDVLAAVGDEIQHLKDRFVELRGEGMTTSEALASVISEGIARALSHAAETFATRAPDLAEAFVRGWFAADIWGRLLVGGWLIAKMGGFGAFRRLGIGAGAAMGVGIGAGVAPAAKTGIVAGFKRLAPGIGIALATILGPEVVKALEKAGATKTPTGLPSSGNFGSALSRQLSRGDSLGEVGHLIGTLPRAWGAMADDGPVGFFKSIVDSSGLAEERMRKWAEGADKAFSRFKQAHDGAGMQEVIRQVREMAETLDGDARTALLRWADAQQPAANVERVIQKMAEGSSGSIRGLRTNVRLNMRAISQSLDVNSREGKEALARNFVAAADNVRRSMKEGRISVREGTAEIERLMVLALQNFGFSKSQALNIQKGNRYDGGPNEGAAAGAIKRARGGLHQFGRPGDAGRDSILTDIGGQKVMVGAGEVAAVFNRHQLPIVNSRLADMGGLPGLFRKVNTPHYMASGGIVPGFAGGGMPQGGFPDIFGASPGLDALGSVLSRMFGLGATSGRTNHSLYTVDGNLSDHGTGAAIDVSNGSSPTPQMDAAWQWLANTLGAGGAWRESYSGGAIKQMLYRTSIGGNHFNHIHVALQAAFANNAAAVMKLIGEGGAGASAAVAMFGGDVPELGKVSVDGPESPMRAIAQGAIDTVRAGAQQRLEAIVASASAAGGSGAGGGSSAFVGPFAEGAYDGPLDRVFPKHGQSDAAGHARLSMDQVVGLARQAGFGNGTRRSPEEQAAIAVRESSLYPGIVAWDGGWGLWQHTPIAGQWGTGPAFQALQRFGGIEQMLNPWKNAQMAYQLDKMSVGDPWAASAEIGGLFGGLVAGGDGGSIADFALPAASGVLLDVIHAASGKEPAKPKNEEKRKPKKKKPARQPREIEASPRSWWAANAKLFDQLGEQAFDADAMFGPQETRARVDDPATAADESILSQAEVDALVHSQNDILGLQLRRHELGKALRDQLAAQAAARHKEIDAITKRVTKNMADIVRWRERVTKRRAEVGDLKGQYEKLRDKKNKTKADREKMASLQSKIGRLQDGIKSDNRAIGIAQDDNFSLIGVTETTSPAQDAVAESRMGYAQTELQNIGETQADLLPQLRMSGLPLDIENTRIKIEDLIREGAVKPAEPEVDNGDLAALERQRADEASRKAAVATAQFEVFRDFAPFVGSFSHGTDFVARTGLALVHQGEKILPAPDGPYPAENRAAAGSNETPRLTVILNGDAAAVIKDVEYMVDGKIARQKADIERRTRTLTRLSR